MPAVLGAARAGANQAWAIEIGIISYDRILLCDELGDHYHEGPHLLVEYLNGQPFEGFMRWIEFNDNYLGQRLWTPDESKRLTLFPKPIPDEREQWYEEMRTKSEERSRTGRAVIQTDPMNCGGPRLSAAVPRPYGREPAKVPGAPYVCKRHGS